MRLGTANYHYCLVIVYTWQQNVFFSCGGVSPPAPQYKAEVHVSRAHNIIFRVVCGQTVNSVLGVRGVIEHHLDKNKSSLVLSCSPRPAWRPGQKLGWRSNKLNISYIAEMQEIPHHLNFTI